MLTWLNGKLELTVPIDEVSFNFAIEKLPLGIVDTRYVKR